MVEEKAGGDLFLNSVLRVRHVLDHTNHHFPNPMFMPYVPLLPLTYFFPFHDPPHQIDISSYHLYPYHWSILISSLPHLTTLHLSRP